MQESDESVYRRFLAEGREEDLACLLDRHRASLTLFLYGLLHNWEDAEELMLDAFAEAASGGTAFAGRSSFKTWLFAIGRHLALRRLRKRRQTLPLDEGEAEIGAAPDLELLREERDLGLYQAMERLHSDYRQVLYLLFFEGLDRDEVCRVMKKSRSQVYNLTERGRRALRKELERMGFEDARYE